MQKHIGTIFKSGNSYAIRVPIGYAEAHDLKEGQKIVLPRVIKPVEADDGISRSQPSAAANDPMPDWD